MKRFIFALSVLLISASSSFAEIRKGTQELGVTGYVSHVRFSGNESGSGNGHEVGAEYGYFLTRSLEIGVLGTHVGGSDGDYSWGTGWIGGRVRTYFPRAMNATTLPYIGAEYGAFFGDGERRRGYAGFLGTKFLIGRSAALSIEGYFDRTHGQSDDDYDFDGFKKWTLDESGVRTGISLLF